MLRWHAISFSTILAKRYNRVDVPNFHCEAKVADENEKKKKKKKNEPKTFV